MPRYPLDFHERRSAVILPPDPSQTGEPAPAVLFLHGIGERGDGPAELSRVFRWGLPKLRRSGHWPAAIPFPYRLLVPQCPPDRQWHDADVIAALDRWLIDLGQQRRIDPQGVIVAGFSMGGIGTFALALAYPRRFAALVPVCGRCHAPERLPELAHLPIWLAYAADDEVVDLAEGSRLAAEVLIPSGRCTVRPFRLGASASDSAHVRTADAAFADPALYHWLSRHTGHGPTAVDNAPAQ